MSVSEFIAYIVAATAALGSVLTLIYTHRTKKVETEERLEKNRTTKIDNDSKILNYTLTQLDRVSLELDEERDRIRALQEEVYQLRQTCIENENKYRQEIMERDRALMEKEKALSEKDTLINELKAELRKYLPNGGRKPRAPES